MIIVTCIDHRLFVLGGAFLRKGDLRCVLKDCKGRLEQVFLELVCLFLKLLWTLVSIIAEVVALRLKLVLLND